MRFNKCEKSKWEIFFYGINEVFVFSGTPNAIFFVAPLKIGGDFNAVAGSISVFGGEARNKLVNSHGLVIGAYHVEGLLMMGRKWM